MGRVGSSLLITLFAFGIGTVAFAGCSADGSSADDSSGDGTDPKPTDPGATSTVPPSTSSSGDVGQSIDSGSKKDSGSGDAAVDAGPPPPTTGDPCTTVDKIVEKQCGACGKQSTVCLADDAGAATGHWSVYSDCAGELAGGCIPGDVVTEACGNCGTHTRTCSKYCAYTTSTCAGQPLNSCAPNTIDLTNAGCSTTTTFHDRSCKADCTYTDFSTTCDAPPTAINVAPTVGSISSTIVVLASTKTMAKLNGTCPTATISTTQTTPYVYIHVKNTLATAVTVSVYNSVAPNGVVMDTTMASYVGAVTPTVDAVRKACDQGVNTFGNDVLTLDARFASLDDTSAVKIAAGATASIYVAAKHVFDATKPADTTGPIKLSVQTAALE